MEVKSLLEKLSKAFTRTKNKLKLQVVEENNFSDKKVFNFKKLRNLLFVFIGVFVVVVIMMPNQPEIEFTEKKETQKSKDESSSGAEAETEPTSVKRDSVQNKKSPSENLWGSSSSGGSNFGASGGNQVNHNTSMLIGVGKGNAKNQLHQGIKLALRILDKVTISQEPVPILAELILDSVTDSGLRLPSGTRLYGEASFQKDSERANIHFTQMSLPNGKIQKISALALGKDGQVGVSGRTFSDGVKNSAGQLLTTFIGGLALGSMETDVLGRSKGGIENGLLNALSQTAKTKAENYGQKLKAEREWLEIASGTECDAVLSDSLNLQDWGNEHE